MDKVKLTYDQVKCRIRRTWVEMKLPANMSVFGIPRGGVPIALMLVEMGLAGKIVDNPREADIIVDDILDSGRTANSYMAKFMSDVQGFYSPYNKLEDPSLGWLVFPWEENPEASILDTVIRQLQFIGEDVEREGLLETPARVVKSWNELFVGYKQDPRDLVKTFSEGACDEMVALTDIEFYSTCEHHMIPFYGKAHIAYLPNKKVIGVSKLARVLDVFARRLQIQERIGQQVTDFLMDELDALGAACVIEAKHLCMCARGVAKQNSIMKTSSVRGVFRENPEVRREFFSLVN